jgi:uncharacterized protein (DUF1684 family)
MVRDFDRVGTGAFARPGRAKLGSPLAPPFISRFMQLMIGSRRSALNGVILMAGLCIARPSATQTAPDPAYLQSFDKWKTELVDDRKQNWLTLAGLFWLKPGENTFGTDASNTIVLPAASAAQHAGSFVLEDKDVTIKLAPGVQATIEGKPVTTAKLQPDISGKATVAEMGALRMKVIVRGERIGIRLKDLNNPAVSKYPGPVFFPLNLNYRVTATFVPADGKKTVDVPNVLGDVTPTPVAGVVHFTLNGQPVELTDLGGDPAKGLSFVFSDLTSKSETYPGGRFLDTDPVSNGTVVLDFNEAYSPPCSVTPYATCPLAPKENRLAVAVPAGEKYDRAHGHR